MNVIIKQCVIGVLFKSKKIKNSKLIEIFQKDKLRMILVICFLIIKMIFNFLQQIIYYKTLSSSFYIIYIR